MANLSLWTIGVAAERLALPRWKLAYLIERGAVPGPSVVVPGRRLFTESDVEAIRRALAQGGTAAAGQASGGEE